jgi:N-carbamoylputrescine amidase
VKRLAAAIQMPCEVHDLATNCERADHLLRQAFQAGAALAVLPEMFNTGYSFLPDYALCAEDRDGPTLRWLRDRAHQYGMTLAAGFVECEGHHLYDSLAVVTPGGQMDVYRKRNLVFWERFRFRPGRRPCIVETPIGRIGLAVCADMIYRHVWDDYRGRIDVALVAAAWPEFACERKRRRHWLLGHLGPLSGEIPQKVARDLGIPVVFANQCGPTRTSIPLIGTWLIERLTDRFAGQSCVVDGWHGAGERAGLDEQVVLSPITIALRRGSRPWHFTFRSAAAVPSSGSVPS